MFWFLVGKKKGKIEKVVRKQRNHKEGKSSKKQSLQKTD